MFIFLDTETTGNGPADRLCQLAYKDDESLIVYELFNPGIPISIDAMSIHHITNEMVQDNPCETCVRKSVQNLPKCGKSAKMWKSQV
jgi:DNA polymerase III epsilon subunit-like protein